MTRPHAQHRAGRGLEVPLKSGAFPGYTQSRALATLLPLDARGEGNTPEGARVHMRGLRPELEPLLGQPRGGSGGRWRWALWAIPGCPCPSLPARRKDCCDLSGLAAGWSQQKLTHDPSDSSNQASWRKANLTCKMAIDNVEKAELLQGGDRLRQRYLSLFQKEVPVYVPTGALRECGLGTPLSALTMNV